MRPDESIVRKLRKSPRYSFSRPLKNVFEVADARQKQMKKRSLCLINEHFESVFNTAAATQIVFQRPVSDTANLRYHLPYWTGIRVPSHFQIVKDCSDISH
jgi:hypothetical protein